MEKVKKGIDTALGESEVVAGYLTDHVDVQDETLLKEFFSGLQEKGISRRKISTIMKMVSVGTAPGESIKTLGQAKDSVGRLIARFGEPPENLETDSPWRDNFRSIRVAYALFYALLPVLRRKDSSQK